MSGARTRDDLPEVPLFVRGYSAELVCPLRAAQGMCSSFRDHVWSPPRRAGTAYLKLHDAVPSWFHHVPVAVVLVGPTVAPLGVARMVKVTVGAE